MIDSVKQAHSYHYLDTQAQRDLCLMWSPTAAPDQQMMKRLRALSYHLDRIQWPESSMDSVSLVQWKRWHCIQPIIKWKTSNLIEQYQNIVSFWGYYQIWKWLSKEINSRSKLDFHTDKQIDRWYWEPMNITCRFTSWKVCNTGSNQGCTIYTMHMYKEKYFANDLVTFEQKKLTSKDD